MMKIGFVVTAHYSERLRSNGRELIRNYLSSLKENCTYDYHVYLMDNGSTEEMTEDFDDNIHYVYIKDQFVTGITGAWNRGVKMAYDDGCDIIINSNDDITFTDTINSLIETIDKHEHKETSIYGPVTNFGGCPGPNNQERLEPGDQILEVTQTSPDSWNNGHGINGFFNAFTKETFEKFNVGGNLYSTEEQYKINAQETEMQIRLGHQGLRSFIVESCMVYHTKIRGWQQITNRR